MGAKRAGCHPAQLPQALPVSIRHTGAPDLRASLTGPSISEAGSGQTLGVTPGIPSRQVWRDLLPTTRSWGSLLLHSASVSLPVTAPRLPNPSKSASCAPPNPVLGGWLRPGIPRRRSPTSAREQGCHPPLPSRALPGRRGFH